MNRFKAWGFLFLAAIFSNCNQLKSQQAPFVLKAENFRDSIQLNPDVVILDVRTAEEFSNGHIINAINIDWNENGFMNAVAERIDKNKSVFIYCLAGKRSAAAAEKMRKQGFSKVYELQGGLLTWRAANLPEVNPGQETETIGMSMEQFKDLLNTNKVVLIDYYAEWCGPCKKLKPILEQISNERKDVKIVRIDVDENRSLAQSMGIDALPTLVLYRQSRLVWKNVGYLSKKDILSRFE